MDATDSIQRLYDIFDKLNSTKEKSVVEPEFQELLTCVNKSDNEKRLASQFITRFIEFFPDIALEAIHALFDLCEDDNLSVRKQVIKDLVTVCGKLKEHTCVIADVFAQLLGTSDGTELADVQSALMRLFTIDAEATLNGMFHQMGLQNEDNYIVIERCLGFLSSKMKHLDSQVINVSIEKVLMNELKKVAVFLTGEGFKTVMEIILSTKICCTTGGRQIVLDMISEILDFEEGFDSSNEEDIHKLIQCGSEIIKLVSYPDDSACKFVIYCCTKVIPGLSNCLLHEDGTQLQLEILRLMAEAAFYIKNMDKASVLKCLEVIYQCLVDLLPLPSDQDVNVPNYKYSLIECYIFVVYKLAPLLPEFLCNNQEKLLDLRTRLQALVRVLTSCIKKLKADSTVGSNVAINQANNIYTIAKDFFRSPLLCGLKLGLSWIPPKGKRHHENGINMEMKKTEKQDLRPVIKHRKVMAESDYHNRSSLRYRQSRSHSSNESRLSSRGRSEIRY